MTLTEFLLARIAEDIGQHIPSGRCTCDRYMDGGEPVYHMPQCEARLVRDAEAKRRIVQEFTWDDLGDEVSDPRRVLAVLAAVYADHPDYRDEWRP